MLILSVDAWVLFESAFSICAPLTLKRLGESSGGQFDPRCGFSKNVFFKETEKVKSSFLVTFNIIIDIFPKISIEIPQVIQKIWRFSSSTLTIFINF